jgi:hypothetical protein
MMLRLLSRLPSIENRMIESLKDRQDNYDADIDYMKSHALKQA